VDTALIIGAGSGLGASLARTFAAEGLHICVTRRPRHLDKLETLSREVGGTAFGVDARDADAMAALIRDVEAIGPIRVCVFNIGANVKFSIGDTTPQVYRKVWEMAAYAGFLTAHNVLPLMMDRGQGTFIFTGATAAMRGASGFSAFSSAKGALRNLAQSCAREAGPKGVHVAHTIIDGAIQGDFIRSLYGEAYDGKVADDLILNPDHIAANYLHLHRQPRDAWTFELDLRPHGERW
jgi:NAD(P)-dependent dehydrogenase (short-subunit alcohol dehydrogenase family)